MPESEAKLAGNMTTRLYVECGYIVVYFSQKAAWNTQEILVMIQASCAFVAAFWLEFTRAFNTQHLVPE